MDAVLFDFNGVLVDDEALHLACFNDALAPLGVAMTEASYAERYLGFDDRGAFQAVLADHGRASDPALVAALIASKARTYARRAARELRVFPGAAALVAACADRAAVAIVSGALRPEIEGALALMGVADRVELIVAAEDVAAGKPDPEGYRRAVDALVARGRLTHAARAVAVEDSLAGIAAARGAGVAVVAVAHTYDRAALAAAAPDALVDALAELSVDALAALGPRAVRPRSGP